MRKVALVVAALAAAAAAVAPAAQGAAGMSADASLAAPRAEDKYCPRGTTVAAVTLDVRDDYDSGLAGNVWARDDYRMQLVVTRVWGSTFCASTQYTGTFTTFAGTSPGGSAAVQAGLTGRLAGSHRSTLFTARWRPTRAVSGHLGTFDFGCAGTTICPGRVNPLDFYFTEARGLGLVWWQFMYDGGTRGLWVNRSYGSVGDISG